MFISYSPFVVNCQHLYYNSAKGHCLEQKRHLLKPIFTNDLNKVCLTQYFSEGSNPCAGQFHSGMKACSRASLAKSSSNLNFVISSCRYGTVQRSFLFLL